MHLYFGRKSSKIQKALLIGGGFSSGQLLYIIPLAHGYSKRNKITKWIFTQNIESEVMHNSVIRALLKDYEIIYSKSQQWNRPLELMCTLATLTFLVPKAFYIALTLRRARLLLDADSTTIYLNHAVWDSALLTTKDGTITLPFKDKLKAAIFILRSAKKTQKTINRHDVSCAFLGHSTYSGRACIAELQKNANTSIYVDGGHRLLRFRDLDSTKSELFPSFDEVNKLLNHVDRVAINDFWDKREKGISCYHEAEEAAIPRFASSKSNTSENHIFLHVFKDSPFYCIDKNRIFSDYVEWIVQTLDIIKQSTEKWAIRLHPSATRWGENQEVWIESIIYSVFGRILPNHITVDQGTSNIKVFENAKRVLTFNGTAHMEAACWGIKPIIISETPLSAYSNSLVHKPQTYKEYKKLLLDNDDPSIFRLSKEQKLSARNLLFYVEDFSSFDRDFCIPHLYKNDGPDARRSYYQSINKTINKYIDELINIGSMLGEEYMHTFSPYYYKTMFSSSSEDIQNK